MAKNVVVVGAGVSGLTSALLLARTGRYNITLVAKHMPGDYDIEYASPWAGANWLPFGKAGSVQAGYERDTFPELSRLATDVIEAGIHFQDAIIYRRTKDVGTDVGEWMKELASPNAWYKDVAPNFRALEQHELPTGMDGGSRFTSVCINTAIYLPWLLSQCLRHKIVFRRATLTRLSDAATLHHTSRPAHLIVNCTGLSSLHIADVRDTALYPARGQIVLVRNCPDVMVSVSGTDDGADEAAYTMTRAAGGGCILGGCLQKGNWESGVDHNLAVRIMNRAVAICPSLVPEGKGIEALDVIRHGVGLRPMREGGIRIEKGVVEGKKGRVLVVHNYGHGGYGYQTSYGCAEAVVKLVEESFGERARL